MNEFDYENRFRKLDELTMKLGFYLDILHAATGNYDEAPPACVTNYFLKDISKIMLDIRRAITSPWEV